MKQRRFVLVIVLVALVGMSCCYFYSASFSQKMLDHATNLKAESLGLLEHATESYGEHEEEMDSLLGKIDNAIEDAKAIRCNDSVGQWQSVYDMLERFGAHWEERQVVEERIVKRYAQDVSRLFDMVIKTEINKQ